MQYFDRPPYKRGCQDSRKYEEREKGGDQGTDADIDSFCGTLDCRSGVQNQDDHANDRKENYTCFSDVQDYHLDRIYAMNVN